MTPEDDANLFQCGNTFLEKLLLAARIFRRLDRVTSGYVVVRKNRDSSFQITEEASMTTFNRKV